MTTKTATTPAIKTKSNILADKILKSVYSNFILKPNDAPMSVNIIDLITIILSAAEDTNIVVYTEDDIYEDLISNVYENLDPALYTQLHIFTADEFYNSSNDYVFALRNQVYITWLLEKNKETFADIVYYIQDDPHITLYHNNLDLIKFYKLLKFNRDIILLNSDTNVIEQEDIVSVACDFAVVNTKFDTSQYKYNFDYYGNDNHQKHSIHDWKRFTSRPSLLTQNQPLRILCSEYTYYTLYNEKIETIRINSANVNNKDVNVASTINNYLQQRNDFNLAHKTDTARNLISKLYLCNTVIIGSNISSSFNPSSPNYDRDLASKFRNNVSGKYIMYIDTNEINLIQNKLSSINNIIIVNTFAKMFDTIKDLVNNRNIQTFYINNVDSNKDRLWYKKIKSKLTNMYYVKTIRARDIFN